jgi:hypothetical protein
LQQRAVVENSEPCPRSPPYAVLVRQTRAVVEQRARYVYVLSPRDAALLVAGRVSCASAMRAYDRCPTSGARSPLTVQAPHPCLPVRPTHNQRTLCSALVAAHYDAAAASLHQDQLTRQLQLGWPPPPGLRPQHLSDQPRLSARLTGSADKYVQHEPKLKLVPRTDNMGCLQEGSNFVDRLSVQVYSGKGGAGGVAFHREKFMVST